MLMLILMILTLIQCHSGSAEEINLSYGIQTVHDGKLMHDTYAHVCLDDLDLVLDFVNMCCSFKHKKTHFHFANV